MATGKKRGNGEGSIYQRVKDGKWCGSVTLPDGRRRVLYGRTRADVAGKMTAALRDLQQGITPTPQQETVAQYLTRWLADTARPKLRPSTHLRYCQLVNLHALPIIGRKKLAQLGPQDVQALMTTKLAQGLAPATVIQLRAVLRRALNQALRWGLVARNAAALVDPPRAKRAEVQPLSLDEARALLAAAEGDRLQALYSVALAIGLRQGEALGLRWADIDLDAGVLHVRSALQKVDGRFELGEPKSAAGRRTINLPAVTVASLRGHRARQAEDRLRVGAAWQDWGPGLVFCTSIGTPLDARNVIRYYKRILKRAGLPETTRFHDLCHTCASLLLAQGVSPRAIMETLGHSQIGLTLNTYSHIMPAMRQDVADRMDALLAH